MRIDHFDKFAKLADAIEASGDERVAACWKDCLEHISHQFTPEQLTALESGGGGHQKPPEATGGG